VEQHPTLNIIYQNSSGNTALHYASANGHEQVVNFLLEQYQPGWVNRQNLQGNTALHWATLNGHTGVVEALINARADAKVKNAVGRTSLYEAQQRNFENIVDFLLLSVEPGIEKATRHPKHKGESEQKREAKENLPLKESQ